MFDSRPPASTAPVFRDLPASAAKPTTARLSAAQILAATATVWD